MTCNVRVKYAVVLVYYVGYYTRWGHVCCIWTSAYFRFWARVWYEMLSAVHWSPCFSTHFLHFAVCSSNIWRMNIRNLFIYFHFVRSTQSVYETIMCLSRSCLLYTSIEYVFTNSLTKRQGEWEGKTYEYSRFAITRRYTGHRAVSHSAAHDLVIYWTPSNFEKKTAVRMCDAMGLVYYSASLYRCRRTVAVAVAVDIIRCI